jgi:uncharacterized protein (DUF885 family)
MASEIFEICDRHVLRLAAIDPVWADNRGIDGDFGAATDYSPDGHAARAGLLRDTLSRLDATTAETMSDHLAGDFLRERLRVELDMIDAGEPLRAVRSPFGMIDMFRDSVDMIPKDNERDWERRTARLDALPEMISGWEASLRLGMRRGLFSARRQAVGAARQADLVAEKGFATSIAEAPEQFTGPLAEAGERARAAFTSVARFLREEYAPASPDVDPVGGERYALHSRSSLGADMDPVESYHWAWEELYRIEAEMAAEADKVRSGATLEEATELLDATEYVDGVDAYRAWLRDRHDEAVERLDGIAFDLHPGLRTVDVVIATSSTAGAAYYTPPSEDLSRPGRTWWPLGGRDRFAIWSELTVVFHEGVPGHHLQSGAARVAGDKLSRFSRSQGISGYGEGWALYAERLADELGWHHEPGRRLGMLGGSAVRAARVIIDTGLHLGLPMPAREVDQFGPQWTFEVGAKFLRERGRCEEYRVLPEMSRYCGWPAQASSYKLGERAWVAARADAMAREGAGFDLKRWHTDALNLGPLGLALLPDALRRLHETI